MRLIAWMRGGARRVALVVALALVAVLLPVLSLAYAASGAATHQRPAHTSGGGSSAITSTATGQAAGGIYHDSRLGFTLRLPSGWSANPEPGVHTWQASTVAEDIQGGTDERIGVVVLRDPAHPADQLDLEVTEGSSMPEAFTRLGTPNAQVGPYPALSAGDVSASDGSLPCTIHICLAHDDYVVGRACGSGIGSRSGPFTSVLASYVP